MNDGYYYKQQYIDLLTKYDQLSVRYKTVVDENHTLHNKVSELDDEIASLTSKFTTLQSKYDELDAQYTSLHDAYIKEVEEYDSLLKTYNNLVSESDKPIQATSVLYHTAFPFTSVTYGSSSSLAWLGGTMDSDRIITWEFIIGAQPASKYIWGVDYNTFNINFLTAFFLKHVNKTFEQHSTTTTATTNNLSLTLQLPHDEKVLDHIYLPIKCRPAQDSVTAYKIEYAYTGNVTQQTVSLEEYNEHTFLFFRIQTVITDT